MKSADVVLAFWNKRWTYFVWKGYPTEPQDNARAEYEAAIARNVGMAFEGRCKTDRWTICHLYVPVNDEDAEYRMIPQAGVKKSVAVEPPPAVLVESKLWWSILQWIARKVSPAWD